MYAGRKKLVRSATQEQHRHGPATCRLIGRDDGARIVEAGREHAVAPFSSVVPWSQHETHVNTRRNTHPGSSRPRRAVRHRSCTTPFRSTPSPRCDPRQREPPFVQGHWQHCAKEQEGHHRSTVTPLHWCRHHNTEITPETLRHRTTAMRRVPPRFPGTVPRSSAASPFTPVVTPRRRWKHTLLVLPTRLLVKLAQAATSTERETPAAAKARRHRHVYDKFHAFHTDRWHVPQVLPVGTMLQVKTHESQLHATNVIRAASEGKLSKAVKLLTSTGGPPTVMSGCGGMDLRTPPACLRDGSVHVAHY